MRVLNLGCGNVPIEGDDVVNHDREVWADHVDIAWDLNLMPWPWADNTFTGIVAHSVLEHLDDFMGFFNECWRTLKPGGEISVVVPKHGHVNVVIDPTHRRGYLVESFQFLDPETEWGKRGTMYSRFKWELYRARDDGTNIHVKLRVRK